MWKRVLLSIFCVTNICGWTDLQAQNLRVNDHNTNAWLMYFGSHTINQKWGIHTEAQIRRAEVVETWQQILLRGGINYNITKNAMATLGYAFIETFPYGGYPASEAFPEHRIYQQLQFRNKEGILPLLHRFRQEQRWVTPAGKDTAVYTNRTRYMFRAVLPLVKPTEENRSVYQPNGLYLAAYDEIFVNFGKNVQQNVFDQNRLYFAIGFKTSSFGSVEAGYLNQILQKGNGRIFEYNHTLQLAYYYNINFSANK